MRWKRFLEDLSKAMIMTDPIAYGWYMVWALESEQRTQSDASKRAAEPLLPGGLRLSRRPG